MHGRIRHAVIGAAMYALSTGTLWYHMNVYWAHELLVPVFLVALVVFVRRQGRLRPGARACSSCRTAPSARG